LGNLRLPQPAADFVPRSPREQGLLSLPITLAHALAVSELPALHVDPFDRLLVAQARCEDAALLTADPLVAQYDVELIGAGRGRAPARARRRRR
jgi:PIN domain nuclease of toxin-antitoxin system